MGGRAPANWLEGLRRRDGARALREVTLERLRDAVAETGEQICACACILVLMEQVVCGPHQLADVDRLGRAHAPEA